MRIFLCSSKYNYGKVPPIKEWLEKAGHIVTPPNSFDEPMKEEEMKSLSPEEHQAWKANMMRLDKEKISQNDAILVLNFEKNGQPNYIGGATFLEIYKAFDLGKKIYLYNPIPDTFLKDEIVGMSAEVINGDLNKIVE
jgi:hypothetical protein